MVRVGLLVEAVYHAGEPVFLGTAHPDAWPALRQQLDGDGVDWMAVELHPSDAEGGVLVFATRSFTCRRAPALARMLQQRGECSRQLEARTAAASMLGAGRADGAVVTASEYWSSFIHFGD